MHRCADVWDFPSTENMLLRLQQWQFHYKPIFTCLELSDLYYFVIEVYIWSLTYRSFFFFWGFTKPINPFLSYQRVKKCFSHLLDSCSPVMALIFAQKSLQSLIAISSLMCLNDFLCAFKKWLNLTSLNLPRGQCSLSNSSQASLGLLL